MIISTVELLLILVYFFDPIVTETSSVSWVRNKSRFVVFCKSIFCVVCHDMFLSTSAVLLLLVYFFDNIVIGTHSVKLIRNKSGVFFHIFYHTEYLCTHVLNNTDQK